MVTMAEKPWLKQYKMGPYKLPHTKEPYPRDNCSQYSGCHGG